jgi:hypothetical protein
MTQAGVQYINMVLLASASSLNKRGVTGELQDAAKHFSYRM